MGGRDCMPCGCEAIDGTIEYCGTHGAAPNMLEALTVMLTLAPCHDSTGCECHYCDARIIARAAIAKAAGESR